MQPPKSIRRTRGLVPASGLLRGQIKAASESRGFSDSRVLTHWAEIVGEEIARMARPVKISYTKDGFGASLTLLTIGAAAPMLEMQKPKIKERVNACFGYSAISRIVITQTAPTGFAEGQVAFATAPVATPKVDPAIVRKATEAAAPVHDETLRHALEALGQNILTRPTKQKGT
jgi:hypothetical protein